MNKEITIYELLSIIYIDKAPKKIKYENEIYELTTEKNDYFCYENQDWFTKQITSLGCLDDKVEIIEEDNKIEKFSPCLGGIMSFESVEHIFEIYEDEINYLIDEVNKLKEDK